MKWLLIVMLSVPCCAAPKKFIVWTAANAALASADYETALRVQGPTKPCYETDPIWGSPNPSRARFYGEGMPLDLAVETGMYLLGRKVHILRWVGFSAVSFAHAYGTYTNVKCH